ncbi:MAG TPA: methyltransferase domain-containing protein [Dehalococcoidia bacterium]|nr:methyltransferase domain-containing protein [Dehalococcoidia bacterium]
MPIDFHAPANRHTYATRWVDRSWVEGVTVLIDPAGKRVLDIGCGGGTYTRAWAELGAAEVTGIDFSEPFLATAAERCRDLPQVGFRRADATATGLPDGCAEIVFERALIHHLADRAALVREAHRLLVPGGTYLVQDRTPDDVRLPGAPDHPRGYLFERFPRLLAIEAGRRPETAEVRGWLRAAGFREMGDFVLWETRQVHPTVEALAADYLDRHGRSILHELSDEELAEFVAELKERLPDAGPVTERDRWTIWWARK